MVIKLRKKEMSTKKVLLISIMLIALTALLTGVGTMAYFSSTQTSGPNLLSTGSISINVNGQDPWSGTFNATLADVKPGLKRWGNVSIQNTGQNQADLWLNTINVVTNNGSNTSAEILEPYAFDIDGVIRYDLYNNTGSGLQPIIVDTDGYTISTGSHNLTGTLQTTAVKNQWIYLGNIPSGATWQINQSYMMDRNVTNWAQTDNMTFNVVFYAQQSQGTPQPAAPSPELPGHGR
jgi:predicted ribosomally synthesized peptide with SipW-like signal peptide